MSPACAGQGADAPAIDQAYVALGASAPQGVLTFGTWLEEEISELEPAHAWTFELGARASVTLRTEATREGELDTVLSLYRWSHRGWGRPIARNDDVAGTVLSAVSRKLGAGRYRVVVRGHDEGALGGFILASECTGAGCPEQTPACLFGESLLELREHPAFETMAISTLNAPSLPNLSEVDRAQLLATLRLNYAEGDAPSLEEAIALADRGEVTRLALRHAASEREFVVYEQAQATPRWARCSRATT